MIEIYFLKLILTIDLALKCVLICMWIFFYFFGNKPSVPLEHIKLKLLLNINKTILTNLYPLKKILI